MILDIIVGIIVIISGIIGIKKGMISIIVKLIGVILAITLSYLFYENLADYLNENYMWKEKIATSVKNIIIQDNSKNDERLEPNQKEENNENDMVVEENKITEILSKFNLTSKIDILNAKNEVDDQRVLADVIAEKIAGYVLNIASFLIIFVIISIIAAIVELILVFVFSIPGLKQINKAGGFIAQAVLSMIKLCIVLQIIKIMSPLSFMSWVNELIASSTIVKFIYDHNILTGILSNIKL